MAAARDRPSTATGSCSRAPTCAPQAGGHSSATLIFSRRASPASSRAATCRSARSGGSPRPWAREAWRLPSCTSTSGTPQLSCVGSRFRAARASHRGPVFSLHHPPDRPDDCRAARKACSAWSFDPSASCECPRRLSGSICRRRSLTREAIATASFVTGSFSSLAPTRVTITSVKGLLRPPEGRRARGAGRPAGSVSLRRPGRRSGPRRARVPRGGGQRRGRAHRGAR